MIIPSDDRVTLDETAELKSGLIKAGHPGRNGQNGTKGESQRNSCQSRSTGVFY